MANPKDPLLVRLATHLSYIVFLVVGLGVGYLVGMAVERDHAHEAAAKERVESARLEQERRDQVYSFAKDEILNVGSSGESMKVLKLTEAMTLDVALEELQGKKIEFKVTQDGHQLFASGVHSGKASGHFRALPGLCTISVVNGNVFDSKSVSLTVTGKLLE